uniref:CSON010496 protein n=1 Tax=Culicoides sonorensis TaxID=179676 RepID=A0A336M5Q9_CULSO
MKSNNKDFVTVVTVENNSNGSTDTQSPVIDKASPFVTVLSINATETCTKKRGLSMSETVTVHRAPGERLGFGLKFQGGTKSNEKIERLFIQSCTPNSPASRVKASWGLLKEGDEILEINGMDVRQLTRMQCVQTLKDSGDQIKLLVLNGQGQTRNENTNEQVINGKVEKRLAPPPPPPVPPRKLNRKKSLEMLNLNGTQSQKKSSPVDLTPPIDPEFYVNLLAEENERSSWKGSESDADTASTLSTVIDRFSDRQSICSSLSLDSEYDISKNTSLESLAKVLKPFQMLEKEFQIDVNQKLENKNKINGTEYVQMNNKAPGYEVMEVKPSPNTSKKLNKQDYENVALTSVSTQRNMVYENVEVNKTPPKPLPRQQIPRDIEPRKRTLIASVVPTPRPKPPLPPTKKETQITPLPEVNSVESWLNTATDMIHECPVVQVSNEPLIVSVKSKSNNEQPASKTKSNNKKDPKHLPQIINIVPKTPPKIPEIPRTTGLIVDYSQLENEVFAELKNQKTLEADVIFNDDLNETDFTVDSLFDSLDHEDGEKLGPPELLAQLGPSEAYFNFGWSPVALSTIGEADEEMSSLEYQPNNGDQREILLPTTN